jgi:hypothetical protein
VRQAHAWCQSKSAGAPRRGEVDRVVDSSIAVDQRLLGDQSSHRRAEPGLPLAMRPARIGLLRPPLGAGGSSRQPMVAVRNAGWRR